MSRLTKALRQHHAHARARRNLELAIQNAATPAMRDDLVLAAQRNSHLNLMR